MDYIDNYCERLAPGLLAEPLNAFTNLSFFVAAYFAFRLAKSENVLNPRALALVILIAVIGTGSTLFHTFATRWAMLSDILPILLFQVAFLSFYARDIIKLSRARTALLVAGFFASIYVFGQLPSHWLNGSLSYGPAFLLLGGLGLWHYKFAQRENYTLLLVVLVFAVSLTFRSLDMAWCPSVPMGLHFIWHLLNGCVLYLCARAFLLNSR